MPITKPLSAPPSRQIGGGGPKRGPELAGAVTAGGWVAFGTGTLPTQDGSGILFAAVTNAAGMHYIVNLADSAVYECKVTITSLTLGSVMLQVYGATTAHLGQSSALNANTTYTFLLTTGSAGSLTNRIRLIANGAGTSNSYRVTSVSVRRVLA